jgi:hypothetical protein
LQPNYQRWDERGGGGGRSAASSKADQPEVPPLEQDDHQGKSWQDQQAPIEADEDE